MNHVAKRSEISDGRTDGQTPRHNTTVLFKRGYETIWECHQSYMSERVSLSSISSKLDLILMCPLMLIVVVVCDIYDMNHTRSYFTKAKMFHKAQISAFCENALLHARGIVAVTHVPWCMSGSIIRDGGENVPGIPGACATRNFW